MSCIHVDMSGNLPLAPPVKWVPAGHVDVSLQGVLWTWFKCGHCGAPGFKRGTSNVIYTWKPQDMEIST